MLRVLSLGAGVQSTTLLLMSELGDLPRLDAAIFADTGAEPSYVYAHLEWLLAQVTIPFYRVSAGNLATDTLAALGAGGHSGGSGATGRTDQPPLYVRDDKGGLGMLWRKCTQEYKIRPIERKLREMVGLKPRQRAPKEPVIEQWKGISVEELQRANCSRVKWILNRYPLIEQRMRRHDCLEWMRAHGFPEPPKSACTMCPYRSNANWRQMQEHAPEDFEAACIFDEALRADGKRLPGTFGSAYVHRSAIPLRLVDFSTSEDHGQMNMFAERECTGMCGV